MCFKQYIYTIHFLTICSGGEDDDCGGCYIWYLLGTSTHLHTVGESASSPELLLTDAAYLSVHLLDSDE